MSMFKRMSATLVTRIDRVVGELEDHDAVVQAALGELQKRVAEARVRYARVQREGVMLGEQLAQQRARAQQWRGRALQSGREDQARAIECLARARQADEEVRDLENRIRSHDEAAVKLQDAVTAMERRVADLRQKLVLMRARESTGRALSAAALGDRCHGAVVEDVLDRWEMKVLETEMSMAAVTSPDPLEKSFADQELRSELEQELNALLAGDKNHEC